MSIARSAQLSLEHPPDCARYYTMSSFNLEIWFIDIEDTGLNATFMTIGIPMDNPPSMPPELFVSVVIFFLESIL